MEPEVTLKAPPPEPADDNESEEFIPETTEAQEEHKEQWKKEFIENYEKK